MTAFPIDLSSFVQPLPQGTGNAFAKRALKVVRPLVAVAVMAPAIMMFSRGYRDSGAMPWDHGLLKYPVPGSLVLPDYGAVVVGMGWMFAAAGLFVAAFVVLTWLLERRGKALTVAGTLAVVLLGVMPGVIAMERTIGSLGAMDATLRLAMTEHAHFKALLSQKGLEAEAKAVDDRLRLILPAIPAGR